MLFVEKDSFHGRLEKSEKAEQSLWLEFEILFQLN